MSNDGYKDFLISAEKFAAYLDSALPADEMAEISEMIENDVTIQALSLTSDNIDRLMTQNLDLPDELLSDNFEIPGLDDDSAYEGAIPYDDLSDDLAVFADNISDIIEHKTEYFLEQGDSFSAEEVSILSENINNHFKNSKDMATTKSYGYEPNYELENFDPNIYQGYNNTCAIRSQEIVLRDYGIMLSQDELVQYATENGWFNPDPEHGGTDKENVGNILDACGVTTTRTEDASIYDIIAELRAGHRVIVSVDADELWVKNEPNLFKRLFGEAINHVNDSVQDFLGIEGANHALVVAGVNVNPQDPSDISVTLIDSGTGQVCIEYNFKDFQNAWNDGHCLMISTNEPAPFQYNYETHQMEPSNFETNFASTMVDMPALLANHFNISEEYLSTYENYSPTFDDNERLIDVVLEQFGITSEDSGDNSDEPNENRCLDDEDNQDNNDSYSSDESEDDDTYSEEEYGDSTSEDDSSEEDESEDHYSEYDNPTDDSQLSDDLDTGIDG